MPLAAIIIGAVLLDLAFRGTEHEFAKQLGQDFGQGSEFLAWAASIAILGALGYVPALRQVSKLALALVILVMVIRNKGGFQQIAQLIEHPPAPAPAIPLSSYGSSSSSGGGGLLGGAGELAGGVGELIGGLF